MTQGNPWVDGSAVATRTAVQSWEEWLPDQSRPHQAAPEAGGRLPAVEPIPPLTGPAGPQPHVPIPDDALPVRLVDEPATLWVVGAHGGSGESSIAQLVDGWAAAGHGWPQLAGDAPAPCVLVARTNVRGLLAARSALAQWAGSGAGSSARLVGLILVADAPGKLPPPLRDLAKVVAGGAPRKWEVPWLDRWRLGDPVTEGLPRSVSKTVGQLRSLAASTDVEAGPSNLSKEER